MAMHQESRQFQGDEARVGAAVRAAALELGYPAGESTGNALVLKEKFALLSFNRPATLTVELKSDAEATEVSAQAKNFGFGPIQKNAMRSRVEKFFDGVASQLA